MRAAEPPPSSAATSPPPKMHPTPGGPYAKHIPYVADEEFRYCSKCNGYYCYCSEHIHNHVHIE